MVDRPNRPKTKIIFGPRIKYTTIPDLLKHMTDTQVLGIYKEFRSVRLTNLVLYPIFIIQGRKIIYVDSLEVDGQITKVSSAFYQSSGKSRSTGLDGTWLPTTHITREEHFRLSKPEDELIIKYERVEHDDSDPEQQTLMKYMRFINRTNALTSYFLSHYNIEIGAVVDVDVILPTKAGTIYYTSYIDPDKKVILSGQQSS
jgi:hypothetical protein